MSKKAAAGILALALCLFVSAARTQTPVGGGVPPGAILIVNSGACPSGYTEVSAASGFRLLATTAANGDAGTTGGSSTSTPAGTIASTFAGNALAAHAHELPFQLSSTTATRQIAVATFGTGTSRAATGASASGSSNSTSAAVALSQSVSAGTPSGTVTSTFTGLAMTVNPPFYKCILCQKQ